MTSSRIHNNFSLFQWNCHGILNKRDTFSQIGSQYDIFALSETWLSSDKSFSLKNYNILRKDGPSNRSGSVLLAIKNFIPFTILDFIFSPGGILEAVEVKIPSSLYDILIISIYRHPTRSDPLLWEDLFNFFPLSSQIIITGDFNAHHWDCNRSDSAGNSLFNSSQDFSFFSINDGTPTFISFFSRASSVIDLSFVSSNLVPYCSWNPFDDSLGSDHIPSIISVSHPIKSRSFFSHRLHTSKINRKLLFATFSHLFPSLCSRLESENSSPTEKYNTFCNFLRDTVVSLLPERKADKNIPRNKTRTKNKYNGGLSHPPAPWWNENCTEAVDLRKQALRAVIPPGLLTLI